MTTKKRPLATHMLDFMLATPFGDEIAKDYYGGITDAYLADRNQVDTTIMDCSVLMKALASISDGEVLDALPRAFSGRLSFNGTVFEYTAGQFYNIEVPSAVLAVLEEIQRERKYNPSIK